MDYRKNFKWLFAGLVALGLILATIYYTSITRAENWEEDNSNSNLKSVVSFIKQLLPDFSDGGANNTAFLNNNKVSEEVKTNSGNVDKKITTNRPLNRELLDICLAKAEDEWSQLQKHYSNVLVQCINIDLGLNGEKLFSNDECDKQIEPYKQRDKKKIQNDKIGCFNRYSERE